MYIFNIGDRVKFTPTGYYMTNSVGVIKGREFGLTYSVDFGGIEVVCKETDLSLDQTLPIGSQQLEMNIQNNECDCGGFKTYGSMEEQFHSQNLPCSSLKNKAI